MGNIEYVQQRQEKGCFAAVLESITGVDQDQINEALEEDNIYFPGRGMSPTPHQYLNDALSDLGIVCTEMANGLAVPTSIDPDDVDNSGFNTDPEAMAKNVRLIDESLRAWPAPDMGNVALWGAKRRAGETPIGHAVHIAAIDIESGLLTVMDPSERDGDVVQWDRDALFDFIKPSVNGFAPVYGYHVNKIS